MHCPACGNQPKRNRTGGRIIITAYAIIEGILIRQLGCLVCFYQWGVSLGTPETVFVDFKNKTILERKASV